MNRSFEFRYFQPKVDTSPVPAVLAVSIPLHDVFLLLLPKRCISKSSHSARLADSLKLPVSSEKD